jgi:hypothetical protein
LIAVAANTQYNLKGFRAQQTMLVERRSFCRKTWAFGEAGDDHQVFPERVVFVVAVWCGHQWSPSVVSDVGVGFAD